MTEDDLFRQLKSRIQGAYKRLENSVGPGISDVYATIQGNSWLIELKIAKQGITHITKAQYNFTRTHHRHGAQNLLALVDDQGTPCVYDMPYLCDHAKFGTKWYLVELTPLEPRAKNWEHIQHLLAG